MNVLLINFVLIIILILLIYVYFNDNIREGLGQGWLSSAFSPGNLNTNTCCNATTPTGTKSKYISTLSFYGSDYCWCESTGCSTGYWYNGGSSGSGKCKSRRLCPSSQYISNKPSVTEDNHCSAKTICGNQKTNGRYTENRRKGDSSTSAGTCGECNNDTWATHEQHDCKNPTICIWRWNQYESRALKKTSDRQCASITTCGSNQYESQKPTSTSDRQCASIEWNPNKYVGTTPTHYNTEPSTGKYLTGSMGQELCPTGRKCFERDGERYMERCPEGQYQDKTGQKDCKAADKGHFVSSEGQSVQEACLEGQYQDKTGQKDCKAADQGHFVSSEDQSAQSPCPVGKYQNETGKASCKDADQGHFVSSEDQSAQSPCPVGKYQNETGKASCKPISDGPMYKVGTIISGTKTIYNINNQGVYQKGSTGEALCPIGFYCKDSKITKCPEGTYQDELGQTKCKLIKPGYYGNTTKDVLDITKIKNYDITDIPVPLIQSIYTTSMDSKFNDKDYYDAQPSPTTTTTQTAWNNWLNSVLGIFEQNIREGLITQTQCNAGEYCPGTTTTKSTGKITKAAPTIDEALKCPYGSYSNTSGANTCKAHPGYEIKINADGTIDAKQLSNYDKRVTFTDNSNDKTYKMFNFVPNNNVVTEPVDETCTSPTPTKITNGFGSSYCIKVDNQDGAGNKFFAKPDEYLSQNSFSYKGKISICPDGYEANNLRNQCVLKTWSQEQLNKVKCKNVSFSNIVNTNLPTSYINEAEFDISCNPGYFGGGRFKCEYGVIKPGLHSSGKPSKDCQACPKGTFQDLSGQYTCRKCIQGTFQNNTGQTDCSKCNIDEYQDKEGQEVCKSCTNFAGLATQKKGFYQDISGSISCKAFCDTNSEDYKQIGGPTKTKHSTYFSSDNLPYGLYEKEILNGRNTFHICDINGGFTQIDDKEDLGINYNNCTESHYGCPTAKKHLKTYAKYDGTKGNFDLSCCSKFPTDDPFSYLNSASCKLKGAMNLESGQKHLQEIQFINFYNDQNNGPDKNNLFSVENQQKWNKFRS